MTVIARNIRHMRIFAGVPRGWASIDSGVVDDDIFGYFVATCSETSQRRPVLSAVCRQRPTRKTRAVAGKPHDAVVKFDTYRRLQRHRVVLPAIARLSRKK